MLRYPRTRKPITRLSRESIGLGKFVILASVIILVLATSLIIVFFTFPTNELACEPQLSGELGVTNQSLCLHPLTISVSSANASEFTVPVLVMKPGLSGTLEILYHISASQVNHQGNKANLTSADLPGVLSVSTATENKSEVGLYNAALIFSNADWALYKYVIDTSSHSAGYYAVLPPFYYGFYPPLAITSNPNKLNNTALSMWGFTGMIQSGEFIIPSTIVRVTELQVVNVTVPDTGYCPNSACVLITRSLV